MTTNKRVKTNHRDEIANLTSALQLRRSTLQIRTDPVLSLSRKPKKKACPQTEAEDAAIEAVVVNTTTIHVYTSLKIRRPPNSLHEAEVEVGAAVEAGTSNRGMSSIGSIERIS